jgi:uroporphyrinogen-III decarboxylase
MPAGGFFFDTIIRQENFDEEHLRVEDNLEEFTPLSEEALRYYETESLRLASTGRGVLAGFSGTAIGDIALVPAPFLKHPKGIRDIEEWYVSTLTRREHLHKIFARQCDIALENLARIFAVTGNAIDAVFVCGADFGTQTSSFCSPAAFDELYLPYYRRLNDWIHANTAWKTFKHSCGAVEPFMTHFIDAGFDIINPVQCSAKGMDPARLKERYGERLVFWGGGVDTQSVLPFGTPADVRRQVLERCAIFSAGGGFVFTAVHNLQAGTPVENIAAMFDAVKEFNGIR